MAGLTPQEQQDIAAAFVLALQNSPIQTTLDNINKTLQNTNPNQQNNINIPQDTLESELNDLSDTNNTVETQTGITKDHLAETGQFMNSLAAMGGDAIDIYKKTDQSIRNLRDVFGETVFDPVYETFGGLQDINNITNTTSKSLVEFGKSIEETVLGNMSTMDEGLKAMIPNTNMQTDIYIRAFGTREAAFKAYGEVVDEFFDRNMMKFTEFTETNQVQAHQMTTYMKGLGISTQELSGLMQETIRRSGEMNTGLLEEISHYSKAIEGATGQAYKKISDGIVQLVLDVQNFGDIQVDEAARIASSLDQLGVSYQSFGTMVNKFMSFDSAAQSISDLTAVFGVHLDAMEMMRLANEDEEEFLHRLRDAFDEQGIAMDDLSKSQRNMIAQSLGMQATEIDQFFAEDMLMGVEDLTAATEDAGEVDPAKAFQDMLEQAKYIAPTIDDIQEAAKKNILFSIGPEKLEESARHMSAFNQGLHDTVTAFNVTGMEKIRTAFDKITQGLNDMSTAEGFKTKMEGLGLKGMGGFIDAMFEKLKGSKFYPQSVPPAYEPLIEGAELAAKAMSEAFNGELILEAPEINQENMKDLKMEIPAKILPEVGEVINDALERIENKKLQLDQKIDTRLQSIEQFLKDFKIIMESLKTEIGNIPPDINFDIPVKINDKKIGEVLSKLVWNGRSFTMNQVD